MKKLLTVFIAVALLGAQSPLAHAATATYSVEKVLSGSVPTSVSYGTSSCKKLPIKYKASTGLAYPKHLIFLGLTDKSGNEIASTDVKVGDAYGLNQGGAPYSGTVYIEVCKTSKSVLVDEDCDPAIGQDDGTDCEYEDTVAVKPGTYYFQASVMQIKPSYASAESKKIKIVITK
jgi:hypothetical protein